MDGIIFLGNISMRLSILTSKTSGYQRAFVYSEDFLASLLGESYYQWDVFDTMCKEQGQ